jgi:hypothetical protein
MYEFGRYRLTYEPPSDVVETEISMTISSDATLPQMVELFQNFLQVNGYLLDGAVLKVSEE